MEQEGNYIINKGKGDIDEYKVKILSGSTVISLLEDLAKREKFKIKIAGRSPRIIVETIAGFKNGENKKYWQYWVNDKLGRTAADRKKIKKGNKIEWKFEVPPELLNNYK